MSEEIKKEEVQKPLIRQIIIETDGTNIHLAKCESSSLELTAILNNLLMFINKK